MSDGVMEAVKVVDGLPFALARHLQRLHDSAVALGFPPPDSAAIRHDIAQALRGQASGLSRMRITYAAGVHDVAVAPMEPHVGPAVVVRAPWPRNEGSIVAGHKVTAYAENILALEFATSRGADEAVFATQAGDLCEGTTTNVFYVVAGELRTPSLATGCLPGVTRALVLEWCDVREIVEPIEVLDAADEIFLASTTRDVQPVGRWGSRELQAPGPVTGVVMAVWSARAGEELG